MSCTPGSHVPEESLDKRAAEATGRLREPPARPKGWAFMESVPVDRAACSPMRWRGQVGSATMRRSAVCTMLATLPHVHFRRVRGFEPFARLRAPAIRRAP